MIQSILLQVFLWVGSKLFNTIAIYSPDDAVLAVHFAVSEQSLAKSCHELSENSIK